MYIGPWQEFKLARILQLKDKVDREDEEGNQIQQPSPFDNQDPQKAYSVGTRMMGGGGPLTNQKTPGRISQASFN